MIDKICLFLTNKIRKEMPELNDERADAIFYGLQIIIGELPKILVFLAVGFILGVFKQTLLTFILLFLYRAFSGGFHLKTHLGCIICTCVYYCGIAIASKYIVLGVAIKYTLIIAVWIFGMIMIKLYAPADTENVPILQNSVRRKKQIASYIALSVGLIIAAVIQNQEIANILIFGNFVQTLTITKLAYRLTNNKYGYEVYGNV